MRSAAATGHFHPAAGKTPFHNSCFDLPLKVRGGVRKVVAPALLHWFAGAMPRGETAAGVRHRAGGANRGSLLRVSDLSNGLPQLFWPQNTPVVGVSTMCLKTRALRALSGPAPGKKMGKKKPGAFQLRAILLQPENSG